MKAHVPAYEWHCPQSLGETLRLLRERSCRPFAGGTDLMVLFEAGKLPEGEYVNIGQHVELRHISVESTQVRIGALATYSDIRNHAVLQSEFPMLCEAARLTGAHAIQNRGTLGGNIANASPAADSPPALLCYDAQLEIQSADGKRIRNYRDFHFEYKKMDLKKDELITGILLPRKMKPSHLCYRKVGTRMAQAISKVCFAGLLWKKDSLVEDLRIAFGSVAPTPLRCENVENVLRGKSLSDASINAALDEFRKGLNPIDDIRSSRDYRTRVATNLLRNFLESAL